MAQTRRQRLLTRASDATARWVVTLGGLLTIGSLVLMLLLIVKESLPLFTKGEVRVVEGAPPFDASSPREEPPVTERFRLETRPPAPVTATAWLLGEQTL